jgi:hypothetical protein
MPVNICRSSTANGQAREQAKDKGKAWGKFLSRWLLAIEGVTHVDVDTALDENAKMEEVWQLSKKICEAKGHSSPRVAFSILSNKKKFDGAKVNIVDCRKGKLSKK